MPSIIPTSGIAPQPFEKPAAMPAPVNPAARDVALRELGGTPPIMDPSQKPPSVATTSVPPAPASPGPVATPASTPPISTPPAGASTPPGTPPAAQPTYEQWLDSRPDPSAFREAMQNAADHAARRQLRQDFHGQMRDWQESMPGFEDRPGMGKFGDSFSNHFDQFEQAGLRSGGQTPAAAPSDEQTALNEAVRVKKLRQSRLGA